MKRTAAMIASVVVGASLLAWDWKVPGGMGASYISLVLLSRWWFSAKASYGTAAVASALALFGMFAGLGHVDTLLLVGGRAFALCLIWAAAKFVVEGQRETQRLQRDYQRLVQQSRDTLVATSRMASIGTLVGSIANEINNPVTYILGNLSYLRDGLREMRGTVNHPEAAEIEQAVHDTRVGVEHIRAILKSLRVVSRQDDSSTASPIDVQETLESSLRIVQGKFKHYVELVEDYQDLPPVKGSRAGLAQVFVNLLTNAQQALPEESGRDKVIRVATFTDPNGHAVIEVRDSGVGIEPEDLPRLFEPYFTTKVDTGTGLGLAISQGIVHSAGGEIEVDSVPGVGTTFRVTLPPQAQRPMKPLLSSTPAPSNTFIH